MRRYYTGVGSRETPPRIMRLMTSFAFALQGKNFWLRSGAADGADTAFERGAGVRKDIYLPEPYYRGHASPKIMPSARAMEIAMQHHPAWSRLKPFHRLLHGRNTHQVLGDDCKTPSEFLVCWTPGSGRPSGTDQAIRIARAHGVPVYNFNDEDSDFDSLAFAQFVESL